MIVWKSRNPEELYKKCTLLQRHFHHKITFFASFSEIPPAAKLLIKTFHIAFTQTILEYEIKTHTVTVEIIRLDAVWVNCGSSLR